MATSNQTHPTLDVEYEYSPRVTTLFGAFTGVALFGWIVSVFLSGIHFWALPLPSGVEPSGSIAVLTSTWAYVGPIPLALLGAFYYLSMLFTAGLWSQTRHPLIIKALTPITASGVLASAYFVYLQLVPIGEICPFCMMSAAATVTLFGLELGMLRSSDLPSLSALTADADHLLDPTKLALPVILGLTGLLALVAFYGVTLAPVPGT